VSKSVIYDVFNLLQQIGAVSNESEFSRNWLCRSECYMRTLRFKKATPSTGTLAICASKLQHYANKLQTHPQHAVLTLNSARLVRNAMRR
jgi:hypothetical protein